MVVVVRFVRDIWVKCFCFDISCVIRLNKGEFFVRKKDWELMVGRC